MVNDVTVAWATPVNAFALGAQIETHVESKASIHTFKLCVEYAQVSGESLGRLPPEMVEIVVAHIRQPFLDRFSAEWKKAERCCLAECKVSDHIDSEVLADMRAEYLSGYLSVDGCEDDSECEEAFEESVAESCVHDEEHRDHLQRFLSTIEVGTGKRYKRFAKCAKV